MTPKQEAYELTAKLLREWLGLVRGRGPTPLVVELTKIAEAMERAANQDGDK